MITIEIKNPDPLLSNYIRKISVFESGKPVSYRQKLMPSAYTYLSYNHKEIPVSVFGGKKVHPSKRLQIAGPKIDAQIHVEYEGSVEQILIEFTASGYYCLIHSSPSKIINSLCSLDELIPVDIVKNLDKKLVQSNTLQSKIELLEQFLLVMSRDALAPCDYVENTLKLIDDTRGSITIRELADQNSISERQLDRRFREIVGMCPKRYSKIVQLHFVINLMYLKKYDSFQDVAYTANFYDLAHFHHQFKEYTGFSPAEFVRSDKHLAFQYFKDLIAGE